MKYNFSEFVKPSVKPRAPINQQSSGAPIIRDSCSLAARIFSTGEYDRLLVRKLNFRDITLCEIECTGVDSAVDALDVRFGDCPAAADPDVARRPKAVPTWLV